MADEYFTPLGDLKALNKALLLALHRVYIQALTDRTPTKTGDTAASWDLENPSPLVFDFVNPHGTIVLVLDEGSKEHIIKAKNKKYLKFKAPNRRKASKPIPGNRAFEKDGYVYAKMVRHPGYVGRQFIKGVFDDEGLYRAFEKEVEELLNASPSTA